MHSRPHSHYGWIAAFTFFAIVFYNLTPFVSVDCWWHMKYAEYFLNNGQPVLFDPFAVQDGKILAIYPDLFPGLLFLWIYQHWSFLGLNILRVSVFSLFIATLILAVRKSWSDYSVLLQVLLLALLMAGGVILQPDLFNYLLFTIWIYLLERMSENEGAVRWQLATLLLVELIWANTHPMFFYYGLLVALIYFFCALLAGQKRLDPAATWPGRAWWGFLIIMCSLWLLNPLGWRALQSVFIHSRPLPPDFTPSINHSFIQSLAYLNTYLGILIFMLVLLKKPWTWRLSTLVKLRYAAISMALLMPALLYERCLPFLCIFVIIIQGRQTLTSPRPKWLSSGFLMASVMAVGVFLIMERNFLISPPLVAKLGLDQYYSREKGIGIAAIDWQEPIREVNIINRLARPGNCLADLLAISSCAVWHCPDKPFFMYGHGAVISARSDQTRAFLQNLDSDEAMRFMEKYDIRTVILTDKSAVVLTNYRALRKNFQLIYMDPYMAILARQGSVTETQQQKIKEFYASFRPGVLDARQFNSQEQMVQYFLLWFSAEITGNDGSYYLNIAKQHLPAETLASLQMLAEPIVEAEHRRASRQDVDDVLQ